MSLYVPTLLYKIKTNSWTIFVQQFYRINFNLDMSPHLSIELNQPWLLFAIILHDHEHPSPEALVSFLI